MFYQGLFSGPLVQRFGCRRVALFTITLSGLGHVLTSFANHQVIIFIAFGAVAGKLIYSLHVHQNNTTKISKYDQ